MMLSSKGWFEGTYIYTLSSSEGKSTSQPVGRDHIDVGNLGETGARIALEMVCPNINAGGVVTVL